LLLDDETIRRHIKDYFAKNKLAPENGGSDSYFSVKQAEKLKSYLQAHTYLYVKHICAYVNKAFAISFTVSGMTKWLHAQGFTYKKPQGVSAKIDTTKQEAFIKAYAALKERLKGTEPIYFVDSVHPEH
jgi:transposase